MRLVLYQNGKSREIYHYIDGNKIFLLLGRIYEPLYLAPSVVDKEAILRELSSQNPKNISGNYVSLYFYKTKDDKWDFKLTTDKYGFRMILYYQDNDLLYFSTHLSGLKHLLKDKLPAISRNSLLHYYHFGITRNDKTLLKRINKVPPASILSLNGSGITVRKYLDLAELYEPDKYSKISESRICDEINDIMAESILKRNPYKNKVGLALSGGVDSGFVAKKLVENGIEVTGYNIAYGEGYYDEYQRIDTLANNLSIKVNKFKVAANQIMQSVEFANSISSEPVGFNDSALRLLALAAKKDGLETLWDGDGADRLFFGMNSHLKYHRAVYVYDMLKKTRLIIPAIMFLKLIKNNEVQKLYVVFENWLRGIPPYPERKYGQVNGYNEDFERTVFDFGAKHYWENFLSGFNSRDFRLYFSYQSINMCPEMFFHAPAEQQLSLGLSPVSPYWHDNIVSLALSIPMALKIKKRKTKYVLRKAAALNSEPDYWMLPKIGLQSAFAYVRANPKGKEWIANIHEEISQSDEFHVIKEHLSPVEASVDRDRLIPLYLWKRNIQILNEVSVFQG